jgi:hypothetical protein
MKHRDSTSTTSTTRNLNVCPSETAHLALERDDALLVDKAEPPEHPLHLLELLLEDEALGLLDNPPCSL